MEKEKATRMRKICFLLMVSFALSLTACAASSGFTAQIAAMEGLSNGVFVKADQEQEGNLAYRVVEGNSHDHYAATQYVYNMLCWLW